MLGLKRRLRFGGWALSVTQGQQARPSIGQVIVGVGVLIVGNIYLGS